MLLPDAGPVNETIHRSGPKSAVKFMVDQLNLKLRTWLSGTLMTLSCSSVTKHTRPLRRENVPARPCEKISRLYSHARDDSAPCEADAGSSAAFVASTVGATSASEAAARTPASGAATRFLPATAKRLVAAFAAWRCAGVGLCFRANLPASVSPRETTGRALDLN